MADLVGKDVVLFGLRREELNGEIGRVLRYDASEDRCAVKIESTGKTFKVHPDNLEEEDSDEGESDYDYSDSATPSDEESGWSDKEENWTPTVPVPVPKVPALLKVQALSVTSAVPKPTRIPAPAKPVAAGTVAAQPAPAAAKVTATAGGKANPASGVFGTTTTHKSPLAHGFGAAPAPASDTVKPVASAPAAVAVAKPTPSEGWRGAPGELRYDVDNELYTLDAFMEYYGEDYGREVWIDARRITPPSSSQQKQQPKPGPQDAQKPAAVQRATPAPVHGGTDTKAETGSARGKVTAKAAPAAGAAQPAAGGKTENTATALATGGKAPAPAASATPSRQAGGGQVRATGDGERVETSDGGGRVATSASGSSVRRSQHKPSEALVQGQAGGAQTEGEGPTTPRQPTEEELVRINPRVRAAFARFDTSGTGTVSASQLHPALGALGLHSRATGGHYARVAERIAAYEADAGLTLGLLDFADLVTELKRAAVETARKEGAIDSTLETSFNTFERDSAGAISARELRVALNMLGVDKEGDVANRLLRAFDGDGGDRVDLWEFDTIVKAIRRADRGEALRYGTLEVGPQQTLDEAIRQAAKRAPPSLPVELLTAEKAAERAAARARAAASAADRAGRPSANVDEPSLWEDLSWQRLHYESVSGASKLRLQEIMRQQRERPVLDHGEEGGGVAPGHWPKLYEPGWACQTLLCTRPGRIEAEADAHGCTTLNAPSAETETAPTGAAAAFLERVAGMKHRRAPVPPASEEPAGCPFHRPPPPANGLHPSHRPPSARVQALAANQLPMPASMSKQEIEQMMAATDAMNAAARAATCAVRAANHRTPPWPITGIPRGSAAAAAEAAAAQAAAATAAFDPGEYDMDELDGSPRLSFAAANLASWAKGGSAAGLGPEHARASWAYQRGGGGREAPRLHTSSPQGQRLRSARDAPSPPAWGQTLAAQDARFVGEQSERFRTEEGRLGIALTREELLALPRSRLGLVLNDKYTDRARAGLARAKDQAAREEGERVSRVMRLREETLARRPAPQPQLYGTSEQREMRMAVANGGARAPMPKSAVEAFELLMDQKYGLDGWREGSVDVPAPGAGISGLMGGYRRVTLSEENALLQKENAQLRAQLEWGCGPPAPEPNALGQWEPSIYAQRDLLQEKLAEMERAVRQAAVPSVGPFGAFRPTGDRPELRRSDSIDSRTSSASLFVSRFGA